MKVVDQATGLEMKEEEGQAAGEGEQPAAQ